MDPHLLHDCAGRTATGRAAIKSQFFRQHRFCDRDHGLKIALASIIHNEWRIGEPIRDAAVVFVGAVNTIRDWAYHFVNFPASRSSAIFERQHVKLGVRGEAQEV